jgi:ABC-2 type transport system permease protein
MNDKARMTNGPSIALWTFAGRSSFVLRHFFVIGDFVIRHSPPMQLHYRPWSGSSRGALWSIWPIARVALGLLLRRRLFWLLYACALLIFLMFFFGSLFFDWAQGQLTNDAPVQLGKLNVEPGRAMDFVRQQLRVLSGTRETYATFFGMQGSMIVIVLCLSGAVLVGNDFAQRGVPFFLSKPIQPWHYLAGKFLAIAAVINLLSTVPALVLFAQQTSNDWNYLLNPDFFRASGGKGPAGWPLLLGILAYGGLLTVVLGLILLASAALVQRTMPLILVWASLFLFLRSLSRALVDGLRYDVHWRLIDLWNSLSLLGQALLGFDLEEMTPQSQPPFAAAALVLGGVCVLCLILLRRRMTRLEIVRSA